MKTPEKRAEVLYLLLKLDAIEAFDTYIHIFESQVDYEDQGGEISVDFENLTTTIRGYLKETFNVDNKQEFGAVYLTETAINVAFDNKGKASLTNRFDSLDELRTAMEDLGPFMYLDLDKVFKE